MGPSNTFRRTVAGRRREAIGAFVLGQRVLQFADPGRIDTDIDVELGTGSKSGYGTFVAVILIVTAE